MRELAAAHEETGKRVDQLTAVADLHSSLLQKSDESMDHIKEMIGASRTSQDDMWRDQRQMMEALLARTGPRRSKKSARSSSSSDLGSDDSGKGESPKEQTPKKKRATSQQKGTSKKLLDHEARKGIVQRMQASIKCDRLTTNRQSSLLWKNMV
jgi:hypothetical protein